MGLDVNAMFPFCATGSNQAHRYGAAWLRDLLLPPLLLAWAPRLPLGGCLGGGLGVPGVSFVQGLLLQIHVTLLERIQPRAFSVQVLPWGFANSAFTHFPTHISWIFPLWFLCTVYQCRDGHATVSTHPRY